MPTQKSLLEADPEVPDTAVFTLNCRDEVLMLVPVISGTDSVLAALSSFTLFYPLDEVQMYVLLGSVTQVAAMYDQSSADWKMWKDRLESCLQYEIRTASMSETQRFLFVNARKHD